MHNTKLNTEWDDHHHHCHRHRRIIIMFLYNAGDLFSMITVY
jgi:hypothetical protein